MRGIKLFIIIFTFILLVACSPSIKETTYNPETEDMVNQADELTKDEKDLFGSAVTFAKDNKIDLEGQTVSKIIEDEEFRLEEERQKEEDRKKELQRQKEEEQKRLNDSLQITLDGKSVIPEDTDAWRFSDIIVFDFTFNNTTDKDIRGFKGTTILNDLFGDTIQKINISYDDGVSANSEVFWQGTLEVNQFMDKDIKLRDMDFKNINFEFEMDTIIFSDGTTISKY